MKVLVIANQKGGVGKSTLAVHLAWLALEQGRSVLVVDLDGQANSSRTFASRFTGIPASALFSAEPGALEQAPQKVADRLWLIPPDIAINDVESQALTTIQHPATHLRRLDLPADTLVIVDTPPSLGRRLIAALIAADAVVSPLSLNGYALQGITDLQRTIQMVVGRFNPNLKNLGLLVNMVNSRAGTHGAMLAALRGALGESLLPVTIGHRVAIGDAVDRGKPVWRATKGASALEAAAEMRAACTLILERVL